MFFNFQFLWQVVGHVLRAQRHTRLGRVYEVVLLPRIPRRLDLISFTRYVRRIGRQCVDGARSVPVYLLPYIHDLYCIYLSDTCTIPLHVRLVAGALLCVPEQQRIGYIVWSRWAQHLLIGKPWLSDGNGVMWVTSCLLYTSPSPRDGLLSRMPSSA